MPIYKPLDLLANATICVLLKAMFYLNKKPFERISSRNSSTVKPSAQVSSAAGTPSAGTKNCTECARGVAAPGTGPLRGPWCACRTAKATRGVRGEGRDGCPRLDAPSMALGPACGDAQGCGGSTSAGGSALGPSSPAGTSANRAGNTTGEQPQLPAIHGSPLRKNKPKFRGGSSPQFSRSAQLAMPLLHSKLAFLDLTWQTFTYASDLRGAVLPCPCRVQRTSCTKHLWAHPDFLQMFKPKNFLLCTETERTGFKR